MRQQTRSRWLLYFTLFQVLIGFGIITPVMPTLARQLGAGSVEMGLLTTLWAGAQFLVSASWGILSDRIGRRPVLLIGLGGYIVAFVAMSFSPNMTMMLLSRALGGLLSAATIPAAQAYAADTSKPEERGQIMASMGAAMNLGFICGPTLGALIAPFGVQATFFAAAGLALVNLILTLVLLPEPEHRQAAVGPKQASVGRTRIAQALRGPNAIFYILAFIATFGGSQMFSMLGFFMMDRFNYGAAQTGIAFTVEGLAAALLQVFLVGPAVRYLGATRTVRAALIAGVLGFLCLVFAPGLWGILIGLVLIAAAIDCLRPTVSGLLSERTTMQQGLTMGIQTSFDALGRTIGPLWAGVIYYIDPRMPFGVIAVVYLAFYFWTGRALAGGEATETEAAVK